MSENGINFSPIDFSFEIKSFSNEEKPLSEKPKLDLDISDKDSFSHITLERKAFPDSQPNFNDKLIPLPKKSSIRPSIENSSSVEVISSNAADTIFPRIEAADAGLRGPLKTPPKPDSKKPKRLSKKQLQLQEKIKSSLPKKNDSGPELDNKPETLSLKRTVLDERPQELLNESIPLPIPKMKSDYKIEPPLVEGIDYKKEEEKEVSIIPNECKPEKVISQIEKEGKSIEVEILSSSILTIEEPNISKVLNEDPSPETNTSIFSSQRQIKSMPQPELTPVESIEMPLVEPGKLNIDEKNLIIIRPSESYGEKQETTNIEFNTSQVSESSINRAIIPDDSKPSTPDSNKIINKLNNSQPKLNLNVQEVEPDIFDLEGVFPEVVLKPEEVSVKKDVVESSAIKNNELPVEFQTSITVSPSQVKRAELNEKITIPEGNTISPKRKVKPSTILISTQAEEYSRRANNKINSTLIIDVNYNPTIIPRKNRNNKITINTKAQVVSDNYISKLEQNPYTTNSTIFSNKGINQNSNMTGIDRDLPGIYLPREHCELILECIKNPKTAKTVLLTCASLGLNPLTMKPYGEKLSSKEKILDELGQELLKMSSEEKNSEIGKEKLNRFKALYIETARSKFTGKIEGIYNHFEENKNSNLDLISKQSKLRFEIRKIMQPENSSLVKDLTIPVPGNGKPIKDYELYDLLVSFANKSDYVKKHPEHITPYVLDCIHDWMLKRAENGNPVNILGEELQKSSKNPNWQEKDVFRQILKNSYDHKKGEYLWQKKEFPLENIASRIFLDCDKICYPKPPEDEKPPKPYYPPIGCNFHDLPEHIKNKLPKVEKFELIDDDELAKLGYLKSAQEFRKEGKRANFYFGYLKQENTNEQKAIIIYDGFSKGTNSNEVKVLGRADNNNLKWVPLSRYEEYFKQFKPVLINKKPKEQIKPKIDENLSLPKLSENSTTKEKEINELYTSLISSVSLIKEKLDANSSREKREFVKDAEEVISKIVKNVNKRGLNQSLNESINLLESIINKWDEKITLNKLKQLVNNLKIQQAKKFTTNKNGDQIHEITGVDKVTYTVTIPIDGQKDATVSNGNKTWSLNNGDKWIQSYWGEVVLAQNNETAKKLMTERSQLVKDASGKYIKNGFRGKFTIEKDSYNPSSFLIIWHDDRSENRSATSYMSLETDGKWKYIGR